MMCSVPADDVPVVLAPGMGLRQGIGQVLGVRCRLVWLMGVELIRIPGGLELLDLDEGVSDLPTK